MKFYNLMVRFERAQNGAVAVDWISLTAGALGICLAIYTVIDIVNDDYGKEIASVMSSENLRATNQIR